MDLKRLTREWDLTVLALRFSRSSRDTKWGYAINLLILQQATLRVHGLLPSTLRILEIPEICIKQIWSLSNNTAFPPGFVRYITRQSVSWQIRLTQQLLIMNKYPLIFLHIAYRGHGFQWPGFIVVEDNMEQVLEGLDNES